MRDLKKCKCVPALLNLLESLRKKAISILPKNHAGPVERLISDFFRMTKKVGAIVSL